MAESNLPDRRFGRSVSQEFTAGEKRRGILSTSLQMPPICKLSYPSHGGTSPSGVGEFQISSRRIGKGGGGEVFMGRRKPRAEDIDGKGEKVAIKVLDKVNVNAEVRAKKEISVMHRLKGHRNIVKLLGAFESKSRIFLVMQYAPGGDLMELIEREDKLHPARAWIIFRQIIKALLYAHGNGIAHRDLKPENVFFDKSGNILLGDWGYACAWSSFKKKARACGSPQYAAPEILSCTRYTGPEVDMFSLGGVLYTMLTGKFPYTKTTFRDMFDRVMKGRWNPDPSLSDCAMHLLGWLLEPNSLRRATMYDVMHHEWVRNPPDFCRLQSRNLFRIMWGEKGEDTQGEGEGEGMDARVVSSTINEGGRVMLKEKCDDQMKGNIRYL